MGTKLSNIGKYTRHKLIGNGNFSDVYEAYDRALEVKRALKLLKEYSPKDYKKLCEMKKEMKEKKKEESK